MRQTLGKIIGLGMLLVLFAVAAGTASADATQGPNATSSVCPTFPTAQTFAPWNDTGYYFLGPAADFEGSLTGWTVKGAAKIVSGNEPYYVTQPTDSHSLSLPKGAAATTPSICVSTTTPDIRLFADNTGTASAALTVTMTYTNNKGQRSTATVANLTLPKNSGWTLPTPIYFLSKISSILSSNGQTWVTFTFASNGSILMDDLYVDPIKSQ